MDIFDQILENLELERDLGTRTVDIDRALLVPPAPPKPEPVQAPEPAPEPAPMSAQAQAPEPAPPKPAPEPRQGSGVAGSAQKMAPLASAPKDGGCDMLFVSGPPLSPRGDDVMRKIFAALRGLKADISVALNEERKAKVIVILGAAAMRKLLPDGRGVRGSWVTVDGVPAKVTFSPDFIFKHFREGSPGMHAAKKEMWDDVKAAFASLPTVARERTGGSK